MRIFIAALLIFIAGSMQSCKEGCKDKTAINYDSKATAENGTCLYCKSMFISDTATYFFTAQNAPDPNVNAIEFILVATNSSISGNGCQSEGKQAGNQCKNYLKMVNRTNRNVDGQFNLEFEQNGSFAWFFQENNFITLGPVGSSTDTLNFGLIDSVACSNLATGTMLPNLSSLQFF